MRDKGTGKTLGDGGSWALTASATVCSLSGTSRTSTAVDTAGQRPRLAAGSKSRTVSSTQTC